MSVHLPEVPFWRGWISTDIITAASPDTLSNQMPLLWISKECYCFLILQSIPTRTEQDQVPVKICTCGRLQGDREMRREEKGRERRWERAALGPPLPPEPPSSFYPLRINSRQEWEWKGWIMHREAGTHLHAASRASSSLCSPSNTGFHFQWQYDSAVHRQMKHKIISDIC